MKKVNLFSVLTIILFLSSCGGNDSKNENEEDKNTTQEQSNTKTTDNKDINTCDDFLDKYETVFGEYIKVLEKYKDNPVEAVTSPEFSQYSQEMSDLALKWVAMMKCATDEKYEKRFEEISDKFSKAIDNLSKK